MAKFKPTAGQKEIIDVLAHVSVIDDIAKNVPGMEGLLEHYMTKTLTDRQLGIFDALQNRIKQVRKDMAKLAKQDKEQE